MKKRTEAMQSIISTVLLNGSVEAIEESHITGELQGLARKLQRENEALQRERDDLTARVDALEKENTCLSLFGRR